MGIHSVSSFSAAICQEVREKEDRIFHIGFRMSEPGRKNLVKDSIFDASFFSGEKVGQLSAPTTPPKKKEEDFKEKHFKTAMGLCHASFRAVTKEIIKLSERLGFSRRSGNFRERGFSTKFWWGVSSLGCLIAKELCNVGTERLGGGHLAYNNRRWLDY
ncbi:hypothetical protein CEXT_619011 [Caerostris extrusa]|uniref:Uncharacterized protein n=1 Tax=Caerostris extrusa TaxID=172846 RepID=A0AAV4T5S1_CAEEX|nr:hypothetical protein CEXT_619011 [Caerostris extrusa]